MWRLYGRVQCIMFPLHFQTIGMHFINVSGTLVSLFMRWQSAPNSIGSHLKRFTGDLWSEMFSLLLSNRASIFWVSIVFHFPSAVSRGVITGWQISLLDAARSAARVVCRVARIFPDDFPRGRSTNSPHPSCPKALGNVTLT